MMDKCHRRTKQMTDREKYIYWCWKEHSKNNVCAVITE